MYYIYILQNKVNNKIYVGQTNNLSTRKSHHKSAAFNIKYKDYNSYLYNSIRKYGWDNFSFIKIHECETLEEINDVEEFFIAFLESRDKKIGYNIQLGGDNTKKTEEHKKNIALSQMGEKSHHAILKEWQVIEILEKYVYGNYFLEGLSKEYNVSKATINDIIHKRTWAHLSQNYPIITKIPPNKNIGEISYLSKLTENQVIQAIKMYKTGEYTYKDIASVFNVGAATIGAIINGTNWKHINRENI